MSDIYDHKISAEFDYGSDRTRTSGVICPWIKKNAIFHFVYTPASTNISQSASNFVKIYMTIRSQMSSIIGLMGQERVDYLPLNKEKKMLYLTSFTL